MKINYKFNVDDKVLFSTASGDIKVKVFTRYYSDSENHEAKPHKRYVVISYNNYPYDVCEEELTSINLVSPMEEVAKLFKQKALEEQQAYMQSRSKDSPYCHLCDGSGWEDYTAKSVCTECSGSGLKTCLYCKGYNNTKASLCISCIPNE